jgi:hypothetical protein
VGDLPCRARPGTVERVRCGAGLARQGVGGPAASWGLLASVSGIPAGPDWRLMWRVAGYPCSGISELDRGFDGEPSSWTDIPGKAVQVSWPAGI